MSEQRRSWPFTFGCYACGHLERMDVEFLQPLDYGLGFLMSTRLKPRECPKCHALAMLTEHKESFPSASSPAP